MKTELRTAATELPLLVDHQTGDGAPQLTLAEPPVLDAPGLGLTKPTEPSSATAAAAATSGASNRFVSFGRCHGACAAREDQAAPLAFAAEVAAAANSSVISAPIRALVAHVLATAETGDPRGDPSGVYVYADGNNRRRQVTLGIGFTEDGGNLRPLIQDYVDRGGLLARELAPFVARIGTGVLHSNTEFKALLKRAGREDPLFAELQDQRFQKYYLAPAEQWFDQQGFKTPLAFLVIADSYLHSGSILGFLRQRFNERTPANGGREEAWIKQYVDTGHEWLATHSNRILRNTIYRTRCFRELMAAGDWDLSNRPIRMNGTPVNA